MAKNKHDRIIEVLFGLSKNYKPYEKVFADHIFTNYKSINILSHHKRGVATVYPYNPDLWCKYKKNKQN